jgi:S1-C subfamily serine protease
MYVAAAAVMAQIGEEEAALRLAAAAQQYTPKDPELAQSMAAMSAMIKAREQLGNGTGFVIAEGGYLLTNHHVIEGPGRVAVRLPGREDAIPATVVEKDEKRDLVLLKIAAEEAEVLVPMPLEQTALARGASVAAFGYPLGDAVGLGLKLTTGVVSALPEANTQGMLLLDCRVNPGNSGGPLCNKRGHVVGVVTAKSLIGQSIDSYGMAVPTSEVLQFLARALPDFRPAPPPETPMLEWDEVDRLVSPSVVMVLKLR